MKKVINTRDKKLSTAPSASRAHGVCHTLESYGVINNPVFVIPRACAPARVRSEANLKAWREKHFGGDFDPVAAIVDEAVAELSKGQPETDRRLWLKIANVIGWEKFADLLDEMRSILQSDDSARTTEPLCAAFYPAKIGAKWASPKAPSATD